MGTGLTEKVFLKLQKAILSGRYAAGSKLPTERELSERYSVSRFAIREAVSRLSQLGLVQTRPQSGTYINDFQSEGSLDLLVHIMQTKGDMEEDTLLSLLEFRMLMETHACRRATENIQEEDIQKLYGLIDEQERNLTNLKKLSDFNFMFHQEIIKLSGNIIFQLVINSFRPLLHFYIDLYYALPEAPENSVRLNRLTVDALAQGDPEKAAEAMQKTLAYAEKRVKEGLKLRENK